MKKNDGLLKDIMGSMIDEYKLRPKLNETHIREVWAEKMGTTINEYTTKIQLKNQVLHLTITASSLKQELTYSKEKIMDVLNESLGEEYIKSVVIK